MFAFGSNSNPLPQSKALILKRLCLKRLAILWNLIFSWVKRVGWISAAWHLGGDTHMISTWRRWGAGKFAPWPSIMLSHTSIYYWQEFVTFILTSDSEAIFYRYHCIVCRINRTIELAVNFNVTWLGFFLFNFVCSQIRCVCCFIVSLRFQVVEIN